MFTPFFSYDRLLKEHPILSLIADVAADIEIDTYVVGGFVRDLLLEKKSKDIDIVCIGSGVALAQAVGRTLGLSSDIKIFKNFGTAMLQYQTWTVEFVGARKESYQKNCRKPRVEDGTLADDQKRRDFTINALSIGLYGPHQGMLVDPFQGQLHLKEKTIQTTVAPGQVFSDDPLRILRAIRFATQLQFTIHPETLEGIIQNATRLSIISQERITEELHKILLSAVPSVGFLWLDKTGLLAWVLPDLLPLKGAETIQDKTHKDNFYHTLQVLDNVAKVSSNIWLRWAALLHDIAKPMTKRFDSIQGFTFHGHEHVGAQMIPHFFRKMKLSLQDKMLYVQKLVRLHLRPIALVKEKVTDTAVRRLLYEAGDDLEDLMLLCRADITSKNQQKVEEYLNNFDLVEKKIKLVEEKDHIRYLQPMITGKDIMQAFQIPPSKMVGTIKEAIKEAILEGKIKNTYPETYAYMLVLGRELQLIEI